MTDIRFKCPHCGQQLDAPSDMAGTTLDCPACQQGIAVPAAPERPKNAWQDDPATEAQLGYLESFGLRPDHPITKGEASALLSRAEEDDLPKVSVAPRPTDFAGDKKEVRKAISALKKKVSSPEIDNRIQKVEEALRSTSLSEDETEELRDQLEELKEEKEDLRSELEDKQDELESLREDEQSEKEDLKERVETRLWDFERDGQYNPYFKKPTKKQMQEVLQALDTQIPNWEEKGDEPLLATLQSSFPELVKKPLPSQQKSGCLGLLLMVASLPILAVALFMLISRIM